MIFMPIFVIATSLDTLFYGKPTCVPWNFIKINVFESLSQEFGADPLLKYITNDIPALLNIQVPFIMIGLYKYTSNPQHSSTKYPFLTIYICTYLLYLSLITHKEPKFILPTFPPLYLLAAKGLASIGDIHRPISLRNRLLRLFVLLTFLVELSITIFFVVFHDLGAFAPVHYLRDHYPNYHSFTAMQKFEGNYYSLHHRPYPETPAALLFVTQDPPFVQKANPDIPLILSAEHPILEAVEFMAMVEETGKMSHVAEIFGERSGSREVGFWGHWASEGYEAVKHKGRLENVPEFAVIDHIEPPYVSQTLKNEFMLRHYDLEKEFY